MCSSAAQRGPVGLAAGFRRGGLQDYQVQQELSLPLERRLRGAVYALVHDPVPGDLLSRARLILAFSRVGFDSRREVATFRVLQAAVGSGGVPGQVVEYAVWAERRERSWELAEVQEVPSSPGLIGIIANPPSAICDSVRTSGCIRPPGPVPIPLPLRPPK